RREAQPGRLRAASEAIDGDVLCCGCEQGRVAGGVAGKVTNKLGEELGLIEKHAFRFCWVTDFPMYELNEETGKIEFSHNPFSMPQGGLEALETKDPLTIKAYQYDIVCNGVELSSGAIRNHRPEIMYKAFAIAGYGREEVEARCGGNPEVHPSHDYHATHPAGPRRRPAPPPRAQRRPPSHARTRARHPHRRARPRHHAQGRRAAGAEGRARSGPARRPRARRHAG